MSSIVNFLETALDGTMKRQRVIANNIANVDTPHYKRKDVNFTETLKKELGKGEKLKLKTTDPGHVSEQNSTGQSNFKIEEANDRSYRNDENNVDIDVEMAEMAKNNIYYSTITQQLNGKFSNLKDVISKGGE